MSSIIYHGPPGCYKTASLVADVLIPALQEGRTVVTNIRGFDSIEHVEKAINVWPKWQFWRTYKPLPSTARILSIPHTRQGHEVIARFFHWVDKGVVIAIDEAQRVYPTRLRSLESFDNPDDSIDEDERPLTVEDTFDRHRHHNWDIYLSTPDISKIHKEVRSVCEFAYRQRSLAGLVPFSKHLFKRVQHDPSKDGKSKAHVIGSGQLKYYQTKYFGVYRSTATGQVTSTKSNPNLFKNGGVFPMLLLILAFFAYTYFTGNPDTSGLVSEAQASAPDDGLRGDSSGDDSSSLGFKSDPLGIRSGDAYIVGLIEILGVRHPTISIDGVHYSQRHLNEFDYYVSVIDQCTASVFYDGERYPLECPSLVSASSVSGSSVQSTDTYPFLEPWTPLVSR